MKFLKESSNKDDKLTKINILYRDAIDYGINAESLDKIFYSNGSDPDYQNLLHSPTFDRGLDVDKAYEELSDFLRKKYQPAFDRDYNDNNIPYDSYNILGFNRLAYKRELERLNKEIANLKNEYNINESKNESMNIVEDWNWKDFAFIVKCNDGPKELVRVVAENKSKAKEYAKDMYAANHTTYADDRYNEWSIEETVREGMDESCGAKKEFKEDFHPSYEELQNGDEIIAGGQHLYVADAEYDDDYVWVTDEKEDRYNKRAPGNTLNKCLIDEVIGQPDDDDLDESLVEAKSDLTADEAGSLLTDAAVYAEQFAKNARRLAADLDTGKITTIPWGSYVESDFSDIRNRMEKIFDSNIMRSLKEGYLDNIKDPIYWQHQVDYQLEHFGRVGGGLIQDLDDNGFYLNADDKVVKKIHEDVIKDPKTEWTFIKSKEVEDSDGFLTDYTWYEGSDGTQVMVFGDNDIYKPEDGYFDVTFTDRKQAEDWFNSY